MSDLVPGRAFWIILSIIQTKLDIGIGIICGGYNFYKSYAAQHKRIRINFHEWVWIPEIVFRMTFCLFSVEVIFSALWYLCKINRFYRSTQKYSNALPFMNANFKKWSFNQAIHFSQVFKYLFPLIVWKDGVSWKNC